MLKFDYNKAMTQVRELRVIADEMSRDRTLENAINKVKASWEGSTSKTFQGKCEQLSGLIQKEVANIRSIATSLERTAKAIAEAERKAIETLTTNTVR